MKEIINEYTKKVNLYMFGVGGISLIALITEGQKWFPGIKEMLLVAALAAAVTLILVTAVTSIIYFITFTAAWVIRWLLHTNAREES